MRDMTTQMLVRSGYRVIAVANGAEAMARLAGLDEPIDVLVTDVIMPTMSGIELAETRHGSPIRTSASCCFRDIQPRRWTSSG